jgi:hypothetical protein
VKTLRLLAALALSSPAWAGYSYFFTDSLTSLNASNWTQAGSVVVSNGLSAPDPAGGSLIYRPTVPDGISPYDYEVRATIALANSGGTYTLFVRATSDARTGGGGSGTYYAFEMQNPTFDQSHTTCVANFVVYKRVGGSTSVLTSYQHACRDGMVLRLMVRPGYIMAYPDQSYIGSTPIGTDIITGQPGIGAYATAAGNAIRTVQIGLLDRIAPNAIGRCVDASPECLWL